MELIKLTSPAAIEILCNGMWTKEMPGDVYVEIGTDGDVTVTAEETGLNKIRFTYHAPEQMRRAYIYGDAWERAYGELTWSQNKRIMPWYCMFTDLNVTCGYGVKVQPNALCFWEYNNDRLYLTFDIRNGTECLYLNGKKLAMAVLTAEKYQCDVYEAAHSFCKRMCALPRRPKYPVYGGNDWYCNYGHNSYQKIMLHAKRIAECAPDTKNRPYMVIDDGWELCVNHDPGRGGYNGGPWEANRNFGDMSRLAKDIRDLGVIPGIWMRPLLTAEYVPAECVLKRDGIRQVLDPSHEETIKIIKQDIRKIVGWGYQLIKHDFTTFDLLGQWGFSMAAEPLSGNVEFFDKTRTTAQIIKDMYQAMREAAGEDTVLIGCNTISHLAAGIFEIQRTGDDTSGQEWSRTKKMGINTLAFRMMQHNAFYAVDADCVGITTMVPWKKNRQWLDVLAKSGTPLFVSIAEDAYTDEVKAEIKAAFEKSAVSHNTSAPEDFIDTYTPKRWRSDFGIDVYDWD